MTEKESTWIKGICRSMCSRDRTADIDLKFGVRESEGSDYWGDFGSVAIQSTRFCTTKWYEPVFGFFGPRTRLAKSVNKSTIDIFRVPDHAHLVCDGICSSSSHHCTSHKLQ